MSGKTERLVKKILAYDKIGLDTCFFIYQLENNPTYSELCSVIMDLIENKKIEAVTSSMTLSELLIRPYKMNRIEKVFELDQAIRNIPNLSIIPIGEGEARLAAFFRAKKSLRLPDCLHLACTVSHEAKIFITNDHRFKSLKNPEIICLSDFVD